MERRRDLFLKSIQICWMIKTFWIYQKTKYQWILNYPTFLKGLKNLVIKELQWWWTKALAWEKTEDFIESSGHLTDVVKFGFGTSYVTQNLEQKIKLYKKAGIRPYFGGTLFEAFYARGKFDQYIKLLNQYDLDLAEISDGSIIIPHDIKCELIEKMSKDRTVMSEVGSKDSGILISPAK